MNKRRKYLLISSVIALIIIGLSYVVAMGGNFRDQALKNASLIELVPERCEVIDTSSGVNAEIEFRRDVFGNIADKTYVKLITENVYEGASASFNIVAKNISTLPLSIDQYTLSIDRGNSALEDSIYFSATVKIYRSDGEYYDVLGSFNEINIDELAKYLTNIMEYRKIDIGEEIGIELQQHFRDSEALYSNEGGLSYTLMPRFIQYFPKREN